jgi:hypothetical protein
MMAKVQFLVHTETKREFQVVSVDKAAGQITLKGPNTEFTEPYDKDRFKANGYTLVTREEADAEEDDDSDE